MRFASTIRSNLPVTSFETTFWPHALQAFACGTVSMCCSMSATAHCDAMYIVTFQCSASATRLTVGYHCAACELPTSATLTGADGDPCLQVVSGKSGRCAKQSSPPDAVHASESSSAASSGLGYNVPVVTGGHFATLWTIAAAPKHGSPFARCCSTAVFASVARCVSSWFCTAQPDTTTAIATAARTYGLSSGLPHFAVRNRSSTNTFVAQANARDVRMIAALSSRPRWFPLTNGTSTMSGQCHR